MGEQQERLAAEYVRLAEQGKTSVVVAQTWSEVAKVNEQVREALKGRGLIGTKETTVAALERLDLTNAQKADRNYHRADQVVVLNRPLAGHGPQDRP